MKSSRNVLNVGMVILYQLVREIHCVRLCTANKSSLSLTNKKWIKSVSYAHICPYFQVSTTLHCKFEMVKKKCSFQSSWRRLLIALNCLNLEQPSLY